MTQIQSCLLKPKWIKNAVECLSKEHNRMAKRRIYLRP